jgi:hypothetical protein
MSREFWYGLGLTLFGVILAVLQMMYPAIPYYIGWPLVGICGIAAIVCFDKGIREKESGSKIQRHLIPRKYLTGDDWQHIEELGEEMMVTHRHRDDEGIKLDRLDGHTWNEIHSMPCHCGKPRRKGN